MTPSRPPDYTVVMCEPHQRPHYEQAVVVPGYPLAFVSDPLAMLMRCVQSPPLAALIDTDASARFDTPVIKSLLGLQVAWPVLRCRVDVDGGIKAARPSTKRHERLAEALSAVAAGDPAWRPRGQRRHLRGTVQCRARLRIVQDGEWRIGNCLDLSHAGAFIVSFDAWSAGDRVELELMDLVEPPAAIRARVAWARSWSETDQLPGVGLAFEDGALPAELSRVIVSGLSTQVLGGAPQKLTR